MSGRPRRHAAAPSGLTRVARLGHSRRVTVVEVRTAVAEDLPALRRVFRTASLSNDGDREALLANPAALRLAGDGVAEGRTRVAVAANGAILGFATWRPHGGAFELEDLFVDPDWMRRGIARQLVADLIALATRRGIARIVVTANPHAEGFYRRVGFVHRGDVRTEFGPATRMQLAVPAGAR